MDQTELLSVAETARRLHRSTEQVRRYLREQRLPGQRIGGQWFISASAIDAFTTRPQSQTGLLATLRQSADDDPLGATIGVGVSTNGDIARGKDHYRLSAQEPL